MQRRELLKLSSLALVGMSVAPSLMAEKKNEQTRLTKPYI